MEDELRASASLEDFEVDNFLASVNRPLFETLRTGLWHRMAPHSFIAAAADGFIRPNRGRYPVTYEVSDSSFGYRSGYVSLFDFESASLEECVSVESVWQQFLSDQKPFTVILRFDRETLSDHLVANGCAPPIGDPAYGTVIPFVEAWYAGDIPVSGVVEGFLVRVVRRHDLLWVRLEPPDLLEEVQELLAALDPSKKERSDSAAQARRKASQPRTRRGN